MRKTILGNIIVVEINLHGLFSSCTVKIKNGILFFNAQENLISKNKKVIVSQPQGENKKKMCPTQGSNMDSRVYSSLSNQLVLRNS